MRARTGALVALAMVASACGAAGAGGGSCPAGEGGGAAWEEVVDQAQQEGTLVLATHAGPGFEKWGAYVQEQFAGCFTVEVTTISGSDFAPRVLAEQSAGQHLWDVHVGPGSNVFRELIPAGALEPIKPYLDALPPDNKRDDLWGGGFELYSDPEQPQSFIYMLSMGTSMFVNKEMVGDSITEPEDLLSPEWRGKILVYDPRSANGSSMALSSLAAEDEYGTEFVRELLVDQKAQFTNSGRQASQWVVEGRYPISIGADIDEVQEFQEQGLGENVEPLDFGNYVLTNTVSVLKQPPHPATAKVFMNWFLSKEGQDGWARLSSSDASSRRLDVKVYNPDTTPDYANIEQYDTVFGTANAEAVLNEVLKVARQR